MQTTHDIIRNHLLEGVNAYDRAYAGYADPADPWEHRIWHALESAERRAEARHPGGAEYTTDLLPAQEPVEYVEFDDLTADQPRGRKAMEYERLHNLRKLQDAMLHCDAMKPIDPALVGSERAHDVAQSRVDQAGERDALRLGHVRRLSRDDRRVAVVGIGRRDVEVAGERERQVRLGGEPGRRGVAQGREPLELV